MGCISSKVLARSISYHEERKQGSQRKANGIPLLEDLIISANGSEQYLALICAANTVSNKMHSRSVGSNMSRKLAFEPISSEPIENLGISAGLDQEEGKQIEIDQKTRSKSWHWFPDNIASSLAQENSSGFEGKHNLSSKGAVRSRSFHTVEEYDDLVNRIWLSKSHSAQQNEFNEEDDGSGTNMDLQVFEEVVSNTTHHNVEKDSAIKKIQLHDNYSLEESKIVKKISTLSTTAPESNIANPSQKTNVLESDAQGGSTIEKGNKRKAVAKRLDSLRIPSNIESPAIASLREWLPLGGIYSTGSYVTPKFGSYSLVNTMNVNANEFSEDSVFSRELVSAFEQCMQELEAEEENILKQIVENVEESDEKMQPQHITPPGIKG